jgi:hypothetical protein
MDNQDQYHDTELPILLPVFQKPTLNTTAVRIILFSTFTRNYLNLAGK